MLFLEYTARQSTPAYFKKLGDAENIFRILSGALRIIRTPSEAENFAFFWTLSGAEHFSYFRILSGQKTSNV